MPNQDDNDSVHSKYLIMLELECNVYNLPKSSREWDAVVTASHSLDDLDNLYKPEGRLIH